jgi:putative peptidoglycan lipid II flippase
LSIIIAENMFKKVVKNTSVMSFGMLVSRILGCIRDILIAGVFARSAIAEAFLVAFRLPNLFRSIFAEGFSDSVATPALSEHQSDKKRLFELANHIFSVMWVFLGIFTILGIIFSKQLVFIIAPGWHADPIRFELAVSFTRITFVYLLLIGISSNITSVLYALRLFFVPAFNPVFLNLTFIPGILFLTQYSRTYILVDCVIVAGILEVIFPLIFLKRQGFVFAFNFKAALKDSQLIQMLRLFAPRVWSSIVYQLSVFLDTIFCTLISVVGEGGVAALYYANRLIQFPFALIALSLSQVVVVDFAVYHKENKMDDFKKLFIFSFQGVLLLIVPISVMFMFLSREIIDVLYRHGDFSRSDLIPTAGMLFYLSVGLTMFCLSKLMMSCYYALKDTRTPAKAATITLLINAAASAIFMFPMKLSGVALGTSIAGVANFLILYNALVKKVGKFDWQDTFWQFIKILILSILMGIAAKFLWQTAPYNRYLKMVLSLSGSVLIFIVFARAWKLRYLDFLWSKLAQRMPKVFG